MTQFAALISFAAFTGGAVLVGVEQGWMTGLGLALIAYGLAPWPQDVPRK